MTTELKTRKIARYGWKPDLPDPRDHLFLAAPMPLPKQVDLRPFCSPVEDQGQLGSCTGHAIVGALELLEVKAGGTFVNLSRLFVYWQERYIEHTTLEDAGAMIRDGIKACNKVGVCNEKLYPYKIEHFTDTPSPQAVADAGKRKITEYQRVTSLQGMRTALAQGFPVVFGFTVFSAFEGKDFLKSGVLNLPGPSEEVCGGHAVLAVGYDDVTARVLVRNSYGKKWGPFGGYFWIDYNYVRTRNLADDFWVVRK